MPELIASWLLPIFRPLDARPHDVGGRPSRLELGAREGRRLGLERQFESYFATLYPCEQADKDRQRTFEKVTVTVPVEAVPMHEGRFGDR